MSYIADGYVAEDTAPKPAVERDHYGRQLYEITCDSCGEKAHVPFQPKPERKVYCKKCHDQIRNAPPAPQV